MASLNLNKVILCGHMTADPELKQTPTGVSVTSFSVAVRRRFVKQGEVAQSDFINIVAWRQQAEFISKYFRKGSAICICGSLQTRTWTDNAGNKRYATEVICEEASFVDSKQDSQSSQAFTPDYAQAASQPQFAQNKNDESVNFEEMAEDDDLPF